MTETATARLLCAEALGGAVLAALAAVKAIRHFPTSAVGQTFFLLCLLIIAVCECVMLFRLWAQEQTHKGRRLE